MAEHFESAPPQVSREQLQEFLNDPSVDLPLARRDISQLQNVKWLLRNIHFRNADKLTAPLFDALKGVYKEYLRALPPEER